MNLRIASLSIGIVACAGLAHAAPAGTPAELCAAAKNKAAFKHASAQSKCYQSAFKDHTTVDPECLAASEAKFTSAMAKIDAKGGCIHTDDAVAIDNVIETCVQDVLSLTPGSDDVCTLPTSCGQSVDCLAWVDNTALDTFGLRISQLELTSPPGFAGGLIGNQIASNVLPSLPECNLSGGGGFTWLLELDTQADTLTTGGAQPVADPNNGYSFQNNVLSGRTVAPATVALGLTGSSFTSGATDVTIPLYYAGMASAAMPLRNLRVTGTVSANQNCIGSYNLAGLDPDNACQPDGSSPAFVDGGSLQAAINLEDADTVDVPALAVSLCVLLTGDIATYGDGSGGIQHCKRNMGTIVYPGDWCSVTDTPGGCADSVRFAGSYAASAIKINH